MNKVTYQLGSPEKLETVYALERGEFAEIIEGHRKGEVLIRTADEVVSLDNGDSWGVPCCELKVRKIPNGSTITIEN